MSKENVPFQLQYLIDGMLNKKDSVYIRNNYRIRLDAIRLEIDKAISKFDEEMFSATYHENKKKKRAKSW